MELSSCNRLFSMLISACILALLGDAFSRIFEGREDMEILLYVTTAISIVMTFVLDIVFLWYITEYEIEKSELSGISQELTLLEGEKSKLLIICLCFQEAAGILPDKRRES